MRGLIESIDELLESKASTMSSKAFVEAVIKQAKPGVGEVTGGARNPYSSGTSSHSIASITFVNAPAGKREGANGANNQFLFWIEYFGRELGEGPPTGKVKIRHTIHPYRKDMKRLRGKTAPPEKIAKYVADYISLAAKEEPHLN